mmetsp:Transcript_6613/g.15992  ORF Transcript_6613/g.15992 Transcript_6613/m.15992 type:complete len:171 (-) Transcript_6613:928-1440(-)
MQPSPPEGDHQLRAIPLVETVDREARGGSPGKDTIRPRVTVFVCSDAVHFPPWPVLVPLPGFRNWIWLVHRPACLLTSSCLALSTWLSGWLAPAYLPTSGCGVVSVTVCMMPIYRPGLASFCDIHSPIHPSTHSLIAIHMHAAHAANTAHRAKLSAASRLDWLGRALRLA